jgi:hypothetical protein
MMCKYIDEQNLRGFFCRSRAYRSFSSLPEQHSSERRPKGDLVFLRRFAVVLTSGALAGAEGGGGLAESTVDWFSPYIVSYIVGLGLGFPVACLRWSPFLLLLWSVVGGCSGAPYFGGGPWRISCELVGSGFLVSDLDLVGFFYYPSLVSVGAGIGDVRFSGRKLGRYVYQLEKWVGLYLPPFLMVCIPFWETRCPASQGCWWRRQIPYSPAM